MYEHSRHVFERFLVRICAETMAILIKKISTFWGITSCSQFRVNRRFEGICRIHHHGRRINAELVTYFTLVPSFILRP
jgi:hypothetical protein